MMQRWLIIGLLSLYPVFVEANWRESLFLSPSGAPLDKIQAATEKGRFITQPRLDTLTFGRDITIATSLYESLAAEGVPTRFATKLETLLGEFMEAPVEFSGSERIQLVWEEDRREDGSLVGPPRLNYAGLLDQAARIEVIWPVDKKGIVMLFKNEELLDTLQLPVFGARLTSRFGNRRHPVYGGVRPHNGIDLAAPYGTPVITTAPGRISFIGRQGGYGRVMEVEHETGAISRYTHLSQFSPQFSVDDLVNAGEILGEVGTSGVATGPNLHYEVRVNDRPIDPMEQGRRIILGEQPTRLESLASLYEARGRLEQAIGISSIYDLISFNEP